MRVAVWKTGHEIADTVADALFDGIPIEIDNPVIRVGNFHVNEADSEPLKMLDDYDCHLAYGILRGTHGIFKRARHWFNVDRGYLSPGHYDGFYRISYRGTQARWHEGIPRKPIDIKPEPWRTDGEYVLICYPSVHACWFFDIDIYKWFQPIAAEIEKMGMKWVLRSKETPIPLENQLAKSRAVITFNSSVGWQALQRGIPVLSDPIHSIAGSHYAHYGIKDMQSLTEKLVKMPDTRMELFEAMAAHQFTLQEIREGKAWSVISHYLESSSATIAGKPLPLMSAPIPSVGEPKPTLQSSFSNTGN